MHFSFGHFPFIEKIKNKISRDYQWYLSAKTTTGFYRDENEDAVSIVQNASNSAAILADGVGGHNAGEVASQFVCEAIVKCLSDLAKNKSLKQYQNNLQSIIEEAHLQLYSLSQSKPELNGMASTLAMAVQYKKHAILAWVGDSRIYYCHAGQLKQLSRDHSFVEEKVQQGIFTQEEAQSHSMANLLTSSLGGKKHLAQIGILALPVKQGDKLLLVSDGVSDILSEETLLLSLQKGVDNVIEAALEAQSKDNCSAILIAVE